MNGILNNIQLLMTYKPCCNAVWRLFPFLRNDGKGVFCLLWLVDRVKFILNDLSSEFSPRLLRSVRGEGEPQSLDLKLALTNS
jgi:hypothetical protein